MTDPANSRNIKLVIAYDGRAYHGWQRQADGIDTIQQRLEEAVAAVLRHPVTVHGAGRTDAGVHAAGQVANFRTPNRAVPLEGLRRAMNSRLPRDIAVRSAVEVPESFHASISAIGKTYRYRIYTSPQRPVHLAGQVYDCWWPLDADRMRAAAGRLVGTHDFAGFANAAEQRETTVRTVRSVTIEPSDCEIAVTIEGDGFLYNMVRIIVGTLIEVGRGHWLPERIDRILASHDRADAGPTVLPDGLSLLCVHYRPEDVQPPAHPTGKEPT